MDQPPKINPLTLADVEAANHVLMAAFHVPSPRAHDIDHLLRLPQTSALAARLDDKLVGMVAEIDYGPFTHIGFMAVLPEVQSRGIGRRLMDHLLVKLDARGCTQITLDASEDGARLYPSLGFVDTDLTQRFLGGGLLVPPPSNHPVFPIYPTDLPALVAFDRPIFGADRGAVLRSLLEMAPGQAFLTRNAEGKISGYIFRQTEKFGPWVARSPDEATSLLAAALSLADLPVPLAMAPSSNPAAAALLAQAGFQPGLELRHMTRGLTSPPGQRTLIYSQTSFALG